MSIDLQDGIREYVIWVESTQEPVTLEEVLGRSDDTIPLARPASRRRSSRGPWPALVAAAVVLIIFGVFIGVFPSDEPVPPADSSPAPEETGQTYYTTNAVPEGFHLQSIDNQGGSRLVYVRDFQDTWLPNDGAFAIENPYGVALGGLPETPEEHLDLILEWVPGSKSVTVGGRPGAMFVTELHQGGLDAPLIWILGFDDDGGVFEISAVGMTPEEVLGVANGVRRTDVGEFVELGSLIDWDVRTSEIILDDFEFEPPEEVVGLAVRLDVAIGLDLLRSSLAHASLGAFTLVTSDSGEVFEDGEPIQAMTADMFLEIEEGTEAEVLAARPESELSPALHDAWTERYVEAVRHGQVLSEDPYVIQAGSGTAPLFDVSTLGEELPLVPVTTFDVVPKDTLSELLGGEPAAASEDRPVIVLGSVTQPGTESPTVYLMVSFTPTGVTCVSSGTDSSMGSTCGFEPLTRSGFGLESNMGTYSELTYSVRLDTSVVQFVTEGDETWWQRPVGGFGVVAFGGIVGRPSMIIAYDADGNEIGRWPA